jgi:Family of unknown function (DUF6861)
MVGQLDLMASDVPAALAVSLSERLQDMERRYDEAQAQLKFQVWQRVSAFAQDAAHELHDFHDAMRRRATTLRCAECVLAALNVSQARAASLATRELAGLDLSMIWPMLWAIVKDVAIYVGGGAVLGSAIGGIVGAFFGGAGAIPGAIGGAGVGAEIGAWLLGVIGIKCLIEYVGKAVPEMADCYAKGFARAWRAGELAPERSQEVARRMESATETFARGHLLLVIAILAAIVLYLSRGALGKAKLYAELGQSKLGPKFAKWVGENEAKLLRHPALQPEKPPVVAMRDEGGSGAGRGSGERPSREDANRPSASKEANDNKAARRSALQGAIARSKAAYQRAVAAKDNLPQTRDFRAKTVASDGERTISGWKQPRPDGYEGASPQQVRQVSRDIGHELEPHTYDQDFPGQYNASHAEKQLSIVSPNEPIGVSKPMCTDCQNYFSKLAQARNADQVVTDPNGTWVFFGDGIVSPP